MYSACLEGTIVYHCAPTLVGLVLCICFIPLGIAAILCWRNQTIVILTPYTFQYTTFLGRKRV